MALVEKLQEKLLEFRVQALLLAAVGVLLLALLRLGPSFLITVVSFFYPLLLSTALFLAAVLVLRVISPSFGAALSDRAGEEFMEYVGAGPAQVEAEPREGGGREREAPVAEAAAKKSQ